MFLLSKPGQASLSAHGGHLLKTAHLVVGNQHPPSFALADLTVHQSDSFGCTGLYVRVCDLPPCRHFFTSECSLNAYHFKYRPRPERGRARSINPANGVAGYGDEQNRQLLIPPADLKRSRALRLTDTLLQVRLRRAREMMTRQAPPMSLGKIAVACGFADQTHFGRHFRRYFGMTPKLFLQAQSGLESRDRSSRKMSLPSSQMKAIRHILRRVC